MTKLEWRISFILTLLFVGLCIQLCSAVQLNDASYDVATGFHRIKFINLNVAVEQTTSFSWKIFAPINQQTSSISSWHVASQSLNSYEILSDLTSVSTSTPTLTGAVRPYYTQVASFKPNGPVPASNFVTLSLKLPFPTRVEVTIQSPNQTEIYYWSHDYAFAPGPFPFQFLFPKMTYTPASSKVDIIFDRIPEFNKQTWCLYIQPIFPTTANVGTAASMYSGGVSVGFENYIPSAQPEQYGAICLNSNIPAGATEFELRLPLSGFNHLTMQSSPRLKIALVPRNLLYVAPPEAMFEIVEATAIVAAGSAIAPRYEHPRVALVSVQSATERLPSVTSKGSWFRWTLDLLMAQKTESLDFIPKLRSPNQSKIHFCEPQDASLAGVITITSVTENPNRFTITVPESVTQSPQPIKVDCYGTVSPFAADHIRSELGSSSKWSVTDSTAENPFFTSFRLGGSTSFTIPLAQLDTILPPLSSILSVSTTSQALSLNFPTGGGTEILSAVTLKIPGYSHRPTVTFALPKVATLISDPSIVRPTPSTSNLQFSWKQLPTSPISTTQQTDLISNTSTVGCVVSPSADLNYYSCFAYLQDSPIQQEFIDLEFTMYLSAPSTEIVLFKINTIQLHPTMQLSIATPIVTNEFQTTIAHNLVALASPLQPQQSQILALTQADPAAFTPPSTQTPTIHLPNTFTIQFALPFLPTTYDKASITVFRYTNTDTTPIPISTGDLELSGAPLIRISTRIIDAPGDSFFARLTYVSKPFPNPSSAAWQTVGFLTPLFALHNTCFHPPYIATHNPLESYWTKNCPQGIKCELNPTTLNSACECQGWEGAVCNEFGVVSPYNPDSRTIEIGLGEPKDTSTTRYYRVALAINPLPSSTTFDPNSAYFLTASYQLPSQFTSLSADKEMIDVQFIPDFVTSVELTIPPLPTFTGYTIFLLDAIADTVIATLSDSAVIESICAHKPSLCSNCSGDMINYHNYIQFGCPELDIASMRGKCAQLRCPAPLSKDTTSCTCICTDPTCLANTYVAMLYSKAPISDAQSAINQRGKSYISLILQRELTNYLKLNVFPALPTGNTSPKRQRSFVLPDLTTPQPAAIETLTLLPMTYPTLTTTELIAFVTFTDRFGSAAELNARINYFQTRLSLLVAGPLSARLIAPFQLLSSNLIGNNALFRQLTLPGSTTQGEQLATRCAHPQSGVITPVCPLPSQPFSQYWSECSSNDASGQKSLAVICYDFADQPHLPQSKQWCSAASLYPNYPAQTSINVCNTNAVFIVPSITQLNVLNTDFEAGGSVQFSWNYATVGTSGTIKPTSTVDIFVQKGEADPFMMLDDAEVDAMTPQQSFTLGYRILLGTFPATQQLATVTIPRTLITTETAVSAKFSIRVTETANTVVTIGPYSIQSKYLCQNINCSADVNSECQLGQCVCKNGFTLDTISNQCVLSCADKCQNGGECLSTGCQCLTQFQGEFCAIDTRCTKESKELCSGHGLVSFTGGACGTTCACNNSNWLNTVNCSKCALTDFDHNQTCNKLNTNSTRTERRGCNQCYCNDGYTGANCDQRVVYTTVHFTPDTPPTPFIAQDNSSALTQFGTTSDITVTITQLRLDADITAILIRDLASSMNIQPETISIQQTISTTTTTTALPNVVSTAADSTTTVNSITYAITQSDNADLSTLYDLWKDVQDNFDSTPIGQSDASNVVGTPSGADNAYDPACDSSTTTCPTGSSPFVESPEDEEPLVPIINDAGSPSTSNTVVAIVVPIVIALVVIIGAIVIVFCMKKHQKGCFAPKKSEKKLELAASSSLHVERSSGMTATTANSNSLSPTPATYSSGNSTSVDLVECPLDPTEPDLPPGWCKMKHTGTGAIIFVNETAMISQKNHPKQPGGVVVSDLGW